MCFSKLSILMFPKEIPLAWLCSSCSQKEASPCQGLVLSSCIMFSWALSFSFGVGWKRMGVSGSWGMWIFLDYVDFASN
jgi:hypothetical protein